MLKRQSANQQGPAVDNHLLMIVRITLRKDWAIEQGALCRHFMYLKIPEH